MRIRLSFVLTAALLIPQATQAQLPISNDSLGRMEGILDFCAQVKDSAATKFQERKKLVAGDATEDELKEARQTPEYKDAYRELGKQLAEVPKEEAEKACSAYLEGGK